MAAASGRMGKADLHIHTREGDGLDDVDAILDHVGAKTDLDVVAITEHDCLEVALRARDRWAQRGDGFDFVPGVELTTLQGHLIALFLEEPIPSLRPIEETIEAVRRQGGVCFVPHPMSPLTRSIGRATMHRVAAAGLSFDAMELASGSPAAKLVLARARRVNRHDFRLPSVGASDAHFRQAIGSGFTEVEGYTAEALRRAFACRGVRGRQRDYPRLGEGGFARTLALPIAGLRATPKQLGWRRTAWSFVRRYWA